MVSMPSREVFFFSAQGFPRGLGEEEIYFLDLSLIGIINKSLFSKEKE
jgi:hypothetical protein